MSVNKTEKSLRRRILYRALDDGTPVDIVQKAIDLLDNEFGSEPEIKYAELIKRLQEAYDHDAFRSFNLLGRIMMVRNKPIEKIGPDPAETLNGATGYSTLASQAKRPSKPVLMKGRDLVFNTLLQHITSSLEKQKPDSEVACRKHFVEQASSLELRQSCEAKLVEWAKSDASLPSIIGTDADLQKIVNTAFVWMCQKFGPVFADKMLVHAIQQTEQLPESVIHSPRKFL